MCKMKLRDNVDFIRNEVTFVSFVRKWRWWWFYIIQDIPQTFYCCALLFLWSFISLLLRFIFSLDLNIYIHTVWQEIIIDFCRHNLTRNWSEYPPGLWDLMTNSGGGGAGTGLFSCWYRAGDSDLNDDRRSCCCWIVSCCRQHKAVLDSSVGSEICLMENIFKSREAFNTFHMQWL